MLTSAMADKNNATNDILRNSIQLNAADQKFGPTGNLLKERRVEMGKHNWGHGSIEAETKLTEVVNFNRNAVQLKT